MNKIILVVVSALVLASCATPAVRTVFERTKTFKLNQREATGAVVAWCVQNGIKLPSTTESMTLINADIPKLDILQGNEQGWNLTMKTPCADCGALAGKVNIATSAKMSVSLIPQGDSTEITVDIQYTGRNATNTADFECFSNGRVENLLFNSLKARER